MLKYDRDASRTALARLTSAQRQRFVAAIAQEMLGAWRRCEELTGLPGGNVLESVVLRLWDAVQSGLATPSDDFERAAALVPDEDRPNWRFGFAYAQNAASCVAYAAEAVALDSVESAVWAGYQLYALADHVALVEMPDLVLNTPGAEEAVLSHPLVQKALSTLDQRLIQARLDQKSSIDELKRASEVAAEELRAALP